MRNAGVILICALALMASSKAYAGAWTLPEGETEILSGVTYSRAGSAFDRHGVNKLPIYYEKTLAQIHAEYGWNDWLTFILAPEYAHARLFGPGRKPVNADDTAVEGGARVRLFKDIGVVSAQLTFKTAGAFDMSVSADGAPGRQLELRFLYGTNFTVLGYHGFFDAEAAERWIAGSRADEVPIDLTLGLRVDDRTRVMVQSFNILAQGNASPPYSYFRSHKLSLSVVTDLRPGLCLETQSYISPAGQNALDEQGVAIKLWLRF